MSLTLAPLAPSLRRPSPGWAWLLGGLAPQLHPGGGAASSRTHCRSATTWTARPGTAWPRPLGAQPCGRRCHLLRLLKAPWGPRWPPCLSGRFCPTACCPSRKTPPRVHQSCASLGPSQAAGSAWGCSCHHLAEAPGRRSLAPSTATAAAWPGSRRPETWRKRLGLRLQLGEAGKASLLPARSWERLWLSSTAAAGRGSCIYPPPWFCYVRHSWVSPEPPLSPFPPMLIPIKLF